MSSGFNNSFEKSFNVGQQLGANAALETLKEKIKKSDEDKQSAAILDTLHSKIAERIKAGAMSPEQGLATSDAIDKLKGKGFTPEVLMNMAKLTDPGSFNTKDPMAQELADQRLELSKESLELRKQAEQDKLEKTYADRLQKVVSNRNGGLGLQDMKVNQAIDLKTLVDQYYNEKTGEYNIPPSMHTELALGLARLVSPNGNVGIELEKAIRQKTAREGLAGGLIFLGADPKIVGGPTQSVIRTFIDSIDRQGEVAENLRDKYMTGLKGLVPQGLDPANAERLNKNELTSSYREYKKTMGVNAIPYYASEEEANKAGLKPGQKVIINGQKGTWK